MIGCRLFAGLLALALWIVQIQAKSVFAHFMLSNTAGFTVADYQREIGLAQEAHIDGFAVNFSMDEDTTDANLPLFFTAAESEGFKLFLSFDYAGNGAWPQGTVITMIKKYAASSAYFRRGSQPLVSTFEGPKSSSDWPTIKKETGWAAWAEGPNRKNTEVDASYLDFMKGMPYMMPVAPWFYTNMPGFDKNWLWRGDHTWFDRWAHIWYLQPEFVQIISWNDYGESHYIGPLDERQYSAFAANRGNSPFNYVRDMPHDGWRDMLPYVIDTYKNNISTVSRETLTTWYRLNPGSACSSGGTTGNTPSQHQTVYSPAELSEDRIFYSALLGSNAAATVSIGGKAQAQWAWDSIPDGGVGIYHGSVPFNGATGEVVVTLSKGGLSVKGPAITTDCSKNAGLNNWNAWVGSSKGAAVSVTPPRSLGDQVCVAGTGVTEPKSLNIDAWPAAGMTCTYEGLCLSHATITIPIPEPAEPEPEVPVTQQGCVSGTGQGNFGGLCDFSCGRGYCPSPCTCSIKGRMVQPPASKPVGYPLANLGSEYIGLCAFACSRGYCPPSACTQTRPAVPGGIFKETPLDDDGKVKDMAACKAANSGLHRKDCGIAGNIGIDPWKRWDAVMSQMTLEDMMAWWELITRIRNNGNPDIIPRWLTNMPVAVGWMWGTDHDPNQATELPEDYSCDKLGKSGCNAISCQTLTYSSVAMVELAFGNLNAFYQKYYDAVVEVENSITSNAKDMAAKFVRPQTGNWLGTLKVILGSFDTIFAFTGAGIWEKVLDTDQFSKWTTANDKATSARDSVGSAISAYEFMGGNVSDSEQCAIDAADSVQKAAELMVKMLKDSIDNLMTFLFSGDPAGSAAMIGLLNNGLFVLNPAKDKTTNFLGRWRNDAYLKYDNKDLWVICVPSVKSIGGKTRESSTAEYPYGLPDIGKADNDWEITWQELARSAYDGWKENGEKLPFGLRKSADTAPGGPDSPTFLPLQQGISTPGFWQVPTSLLRRSLTMEVVAGCEY
ncbi:Mutanase like protein [Verticillium longisporum]|nr:Mutanase like protein [Verticillium longisporum]